MAGKEALPSPTEGELDDIEAAQQDGSAQAAELEQPHIVDAEAAFDDHVARVRSEGDAVSARAALRPAVIGRRVLVAATVAMPFVINGSVFGAALTSSVAGTTNIYTHIRNARDKRTADARQGAEIQEALGQQYELYHRPPSRRSPGQTSLYWVGPKTDDAAKDEGAPQPLAAHLLDMARRAERNNINTLAVARETADAIDPQLYAQVGSTTVYAWLKSHTGVVTSRKERSYELATATPAEWLDALAQVRPANSTDPVGALLTRLEAVDPLHPFVRMGKAYAVAVGFRDDKLRTAVCQYFEERYLQETTRQAPHGQKSDMPHGAARGAKRYATGKLVGSDQVDRYVDGLYEGPQYLASALGLSPASIQAALEYPQQNPCQAAKVFEYLLHQRLRGKPDDAQMLMIAKTAGDETTSGKSPDLYPLQEFLIRPEAAGLRPLSLAGQTRRRVAAGALASLIGITGVAVVDNALEERYNRAAAYARAEIARDQAMTSPGFVADAEVNRRVAQESLELGVWKKLDEFRGKFSIGGESGISGSSHETLAASSSSNMGRIAAADEGIANRVDWHIQSHGLDAAGHWAAGTSTTLRLEESRGPRMDLSWIGETVQYRVLNTETPTTIDQQTSQWLEVSRSIEVNDYTTIGEEGDTIQAIPIPVREGTVPAAASLSGEPVRIVVKQNGTFAIQPADGSQRSGHLQYSLVQADGAAPRPAGFFKTEGHLDIDESAVDAVWERLIPGLPDHTDPTSRSVVIRAYIRDQFTYGLDPLPEGARLYNGADLTQSLIAHGEVDCGTAALLQVLENPWLGVATGYLNGPGKGSSMLSSREAHAWAISPGRANLDAVPGSRSSDVAAYFDESELLAPPARPDNPLPLLPLVGLAGAVAIAIAQRRRLLAAGQKVAGIPAAYAQRQLERTDVQTLRLARTLAEQAVYAPALDLHQARTRANRSQASPQESIEALQRPDLHHPSARQTIRQAARHTKAARDVRAANHALGRGRRAARRR